MRPCAIGDISIALLLPRCVRGRTLPSLFSVAALILTQSSHSLAQDAAGSSVGQAELAMKKFQVAPDLKISLFAAEPQLENPVSFSIDEHGRFFIAETHRYQISIFDITQNQPWLLNDLSFRTVADRTAFLAKTFATNLSLLTKDSELVRLVEDRSGKGRADTSTVFAEGFNQVPSGVAAGILARQGDVWVACVPDLWRMRGPDASGKAEAREKLFTGFGVHIGVTGHDLHGLRLGPDGRLYMSSGDRGFVVTNHEGQVLNNPDTGGVLRCNPDGSNLEIVCIGLRNPQELAFDQYGNLFTDDNDTAGEDRTRVIYIVPGADYGWRCSYQHMTNFGPWNKEKVWMGNIDDALPWSGYVAQGPSGLTFNPGTGLPPRYENHFLVCDFPGGVRSFSVRPKGASYEAVDNQKFLWNLWPTDVDFGPDSCVYVSDWVGGWQMPNKGRLYRINYPTLVNDAAAAEVKKLLAEGMAKRSLEELGRLLSHRDMRVRLEAQYALAEKGPEVASILERIGKSGHHQLARIHALWAMGQIVRQPGSSTSDQNLIGAKSLLYRSLSDSDAEIRAQAAKVAADSISGRNTLFAESMVKLLRDPSPRARFYAALALGKFGEKSDVTPVIEMLRANDDQDAYLTHGGVMALLGIGDLAAIQRAAKDHSSAIRRAALHCLRRLESPAVAQFLKDADAKIAWESARAINDVPINDAMPELARMLATEHNKLWCPELAQAQWNADTRVGKSIHSETGWRHVLPYEQLLLRAINANFRLGKAENAEAVAAFAARDDAPESMSAAALEALGDWAKPSQIDRIMGLWRPLPGREPTIARDAVYGHIDRLLQSKSDKVLAAAATCAGKLGLSEVAPRLFEMFEKQDGAKVVRIAALQGLGELKGSRLDQAVEMAIADGNPEIRRKGTALIAELNSPRAPALLDKLTKDGKDLRVSQAAFAALGQLKNPAADEIILRSTEDLCAGKIRPELRLDVVEAAKGRSSPAIQEVLKRYEAVQPKDEFAGYREVLSGGDATAGEKIFTERAGIECTRCHAIHGKGGVVGPDLAGIGKRQTREYLLESILYPNKVIAAGFENVTLVMKDGSTRAGMVKSENARELTLSSAEDGTFGKISKEQIQTRQRGLSAMPEGLAQMMSKQDLRDMVEFLAGLK
jgi:quinoprotein glucose dehydrogenase